VVAANQRASTPSPLLLPPQTLAWSACTDPWRAKYCRQTPFHLTRPWASASCTPSVRVPPAIAGRRLSRRSLGVSDLRPAVLLGGYSALNPTGPGLYLLPDPAQPRRRPRSQLRRSHFTETYRVYWPSAGRPPLRSSWTSLRYEFRYEPCRPRGPVADLFRLALPRGESGDRNGWLTIRPAGATADATSIPAIPTRWPELQRQLGTHDRPTRTSRKAPPSDQSRARMKSPIRHLLGSR